VGGSTTPDRRPIFHGRNVENVNPVTALRTGVRLLRARTASVLPVYLLAAGLYGIARTPLVVAGVAAVWALSSAGRLEPFVDLLRDGGGRSVDPGPVEGGELPAGLGEAVGGLLTPTTLLLVGAGALAAAALAVVASGVGNAAAVGGLLGLLRDDDGVRSAVAGARRHWRSFVGVRLLLVAAVATAVAPLVVLVAAVGGSITGGFDPAAAVGVAAVVLGGLVTAILVAVVLVLFAFADQAVIVDGLGPVAAVGRSLRLPLRRPVAVLGYVAVATGSLVGSAVVGSLAATAGAPRVTALVSTILLPPVVDGFKTSLYAERPYPAGSNTGVPPVRNRLRSAVVGGLKAVAGFVRNRPFTNLASLGCVAAGGVAGWVATASLGFDLPVGADVGAVFGAVPIGTFLNLATNNWLVTVDLAYSGLAAGVPAVVSLAFNGLVIGAVGGVVDPVAFLALVAPHGVVEVPALVIGGAAGLRLGGVGIGAVRGRCDDREVAAAIRRTYRILLGVAPLFVVAAFIEAFLTPAIASVVLAG
jgi:uncharacterized membrane protein SpoIIM required for sporulation